MEFFQLQRLYSCERGRKMTMITLRIYRNQRQRCVSFCYHIYLGKCWKFASCVSTFWLPLHKSVLFYFSVSLQQVWRWLTSVRCRSGLGLFCFCSNTLLLTCFRSLMGYRMLNSVFTVSVLGYFLVGLQKKWAVLEAYFSLRAVRRMAWDERTSLSTSHPTP